MLHGMVDAAPMLSYEAKRHEDGEQPPVERQPDDSNAALRRFKAFFEVIRPLAAACHRPSSTQPCGSRGMSGYVPATIHQVALMDFASRAFGGRAPMLVELCGSFGLRDRAGVGPSLSPARLGQARPPLHGELDQTPKDHTRSALEQKVPRDHRARACVRLRDSIRLYDR